MIENKWEVWRAMAALALYLLFSATWKACRSSFPTLRFPQLAVVHNASVVFATTMPFYQLVCIAAHYPEYVCFTSRFGLDCLR